MHTNLDAANEAIHKRVDGDAVEAETGIDPNGELVAEYPAASRVTALANALEDAAHDVESAAKFLATVTGDEVQAVNLQGPDAVVGVGAIQFHVEERQQDRQQQFRTIDVKPQPVTRFRPSR